jgi:hypothetical protein
MEFFLGGQVSLMSFLRRAKGSEVAFTHTCAPSIRAPRGFGHSDHDRAFARFLYEILSILGVSRRTQIHKAIVVTISVAVVGLF